MMDFVNSGQPETPRGLPREAEGRECAVDVTPSRAGARGSLMVRMGWPLLLVPIALTALFLSASELAHPPALLRHFANNFTLTAGIWLVAVILYRWVVPRLLAGEPRGATTILVHTAAVLVAVFAGGELGLQVVARFPGAPPPSALRFEVYRIGLVVAAVLVLALVVYRGLRAQARAAERREALAHREALRAQVAALRARTNPHFLYNSLNTVAELIEEDPPRAEEAVRRLSALFRYALESSEKELVPLADEVRFATDYLEMEALRFEDRLRFDVEVHPSARDARIPPLVLQPLVENAVRHGVATRREGGRIRVHALRLADTVRLEVEDDGPGPGRSGHAGSGTAIADLKERLRLLYGSRSAVETRVGEPCGYSVCVRLPDGATAAI